MKSEIHTILGGKVRLYQRPNSPYWQCSSFMNGKKRRATTKTESLGHAKDFAEDWYLTLRDKGRYGELHSGPTFAKAATKFEDEYEAVTQGRRSPKWVQGHKDRIRLHLLPFFGKKAVKDINSGTV
ncbi:hypothetical protein [Lentilitoribacter sp. EG35]|uniref:hypothetical protein n=1 Tax=Lentilitoribacter sp. EG35 TaxID=3234192 RepID=UPI0034603153